MWIQNNTSSFILLVAGLFMFCQVSASKIDTIYFQGGDRVTAEVKSLENNRLRLSTDDAGTINVEWNKVDSVKILNNMRIVLDNGQIIFGKLLTAGEAGKCSIWSSTQVPILMELIRIVSLTPMEDKLIERFSGSLSSGFSYVKATRIMQLNLDASVKYTSERSLLELAYHGLVSQDPSSGNTQNQNGGATFLRLFPKNWFYLTELTMESNTEMDLDLRSSLTIGTGKSFIRNNFSNLFAAIGFQGNRENSVGEAQFNLEGVVRTTYSVFIFENPEISLNISGDLIPSLSNLGRVRSVIDSNLRWEIFSDFFLKWTFYYNYDSRPLSEAAEKTDWAISLLGVEYKL
jgi:hypothetical protein